MPESHVLPQLALATALFYLEEVVDNVQDVHIQTSINNNVLNSNAMEEKLKETSLHYHLANAKHAQVKQFQMPIEQHVLPVQMIHILISMVNASNVLTIQERLKVQMELNVYLNSAPGIDNISTIREIVKHVLLTNFQMAINAMIQIVEIDKYYLQMVNWKAVQLILECNLMRTVKDAENVMQTHVLQKNS